MIFRYLIKFLNNFHLSENRFYSKAMSSLFVSFDSVRGAKELNRELFVMKIKASYFQCRTENVSSVMPNLKKYLLKLPNFKPVQNADENYTRIYLDTNKCKDFNEISAEDRTHLLKYGEYFDTGDLNLNYDNFTANEVLKAIMPEGMEIPSSFSRIGHIIHLNLQDFQLPYAKIIGQVYLDKIPNVTTVVNKTSNIDTTYRHFKMDILVGDDNTIVTVKENKCTYTFDFAKVYWNPRLSTEHQILTDLTQPGDVIYDVFAGVGPFAIPAAKKGISVLANDLNPESFKWLQKNAIINKISKINKNVDFYNLDGRDFLKNIVKPHVLNRRSNNLSGSEHIIMNLPASAVDFLDVFDDWLSDEEGKSVYIKPLNVHVYCFIKLQENEEAVSKAKYLVEQKLGYSLCCNVLKDIHYVRNVAPNKEMMRVSFLLIKNNMENGEPVKKKVKIDNDVDIKFVEHNGSQADTAKIKEQCIQTEGTTDYEGQENSKS